MVSVRRSSSVMKTLLRIEFCRIHEYQRIPLGIMESRYSLTRLSRCWITTQSMASYSKWGGIMMIEQRWIDGMTLMRLRHFMTQLEVGMRCSSAERASIGSSWCQERRWYLITGEFFTEGQHLMGRGRCAGPMLVEMILWVGLWWQTRRGRMF